MTLEYDPTFRPLRKGSRCQAPALCSSQWRICVYGTFHLCHKENHHSSWNGVFRAYRWGGFDKINRRWRNFDYCNCEGLDIGVGGTKTKDNSKVFAILPSWIEEKEGRFLRQKVTVVTRKMVENFEFWGKTFLVRVKQNTHSVVFKK